MQITLSQFEIIETALSAFCAAERAVDNGGDPRQLVRAESVLYDALIDTLGYKQAYLIGDVTEYAATLVCKAMTGAIEVVDGEAV